MDRKDTKILIELDKDPRISLTKLARKVRLSKQFVDYRIKRMLERDPDMTFGTIVNLKAIGLNPYRIFMRFQSGIKMEDVISYLDNTSGVQWAVRTGGRYDMIIALAVKGLPEVDSFFDAFCRRFPGMIQDYKSCYVVNHNIYRHKFLGDDYSYIKYGYHEEKVEIDGLDRFILKEMKKNARVSYSRLAADKDVSYKTIANRIKSLVNKKVILGHRLFYNYKASSRFVVVCSFKNFSREQEKALLGYLNMSRFVTQSTRLFGIWDLYLNIRAKDNEELQKFMMDLRSRFEMVDNYEIIPFFETISLDLCPI